MYFLIHPYKVEGLELMKELDIWLEVRRLAVPEIDDDPRLEQARKTGLTFLASGMKMASSLYL